MYNGNTVSRHIVEQRLLQGIKDQLSCPEAFDLFKQETSRLLEEHQSQNTAEDTQKELEHVTRQRDNLIEAIKAGIITPSTKRELEAAEAKIQELELAISQTSQMSVANILPRAVERYQYAVANLERIVQGHVSAAKAILRTLINERIVLHRRGKHLEAELKSDMRELLIAAGGQKLDLAGCGGRI
ncbi:MAG: hypothetical protein J0L97_10640 [Alphaproteobacteria bacterium]|nr:hypothetical protein [Alphaproteobacteria bacterium]